MTDTSEASRTDQSRSTLATAAAAGSIFFWCWSGVCFRAGAKSIGPMPYLTFSCIVGVSAIAILYACSRRSLGDLLRIPKRVMLTGFLGVALYTVVLVMAVNIAEERDIGQVMLINYLWPIWVVVLAVALLDEKPSIPLALVGALLGFAGVVLAGGSESFARAPASYVPHMLSLWGAFFWALYCVLLKRWRIPEEKGGSTFHFLMCAIVAAAIAGITRDWRHLTDIDSRTLFWIVFLGIGPIGLGYYWWEIGIKRGAVHLIAVMAYFIPIGSAVLVGIFFREALTPGLLPGAAMITAGAYIGRRAGMHSSQEDDMPVRDGE